MAKLNKAQRIEAKIASGMTHIQAEIAVVQEDNAAKVAALKAKQEKEEVKVRSIIVELLAEQHPEAFRALETQARAKLRTEANVRSSRASGARASAVVAPDAIATAGQPLQPNEQ